MKSLTLAICFLPNVCLADMTTYYGPSGQYEGNSTTIGNNTIYYGPSGQYLGNSTGPSGSNLNIYSGPSGQYYGDSFTTGGE